MTGIVFRYGKIPENLSDHRKERYMRCIRMCDQYNEIDRCINYNEEDKGCTCGYDHDQLEFVKDGIINDVTYLFGLPHYYTDISGYKYVGIAVNIKTLKQVGIVAGCLLTTAALSSLISSFLF